MEADAERAEKQLEEHKKLLQALEAEAKKRELINLQSQLL